MARSGRRRGRPAGATASSPGSWSPAAQARLRPTRVGLGSRSSRESGEAALLGGQLELHPRGLPGEAEDALGDDVPLDLVGARVDRSGQREQVAVRPGRRDLGLRSEQVERGLVQGDVELAPPDLVHRAGRADVAAVGELGDGAPGVEAVRLGAHPGVDHGRSRAPGPGRRRTGRAGGRPRRRSVPASAATARARCRRCSSPPASRRRARRARRHPARRRRRRTARRSRPRRRAARSAAPSGRRRPAGSRSRSARGAARPRGRSGTGRTPGARTPPGTTRSSARSAASRRPPPWRSSAATRGRSRPRARTRPGPRSSRRCAIDGSQRRCWSSVPWSKMIGASRKMPFCETRPGAPAR